MSQILITGLISPYKLLPFPCTPTHQRNALQPTPNLGGQLRCHLYVKFTTITLERHELAKSPVLLQKPSTIDTFQLSRRLKPPVGIIFWNELTLKLFGLLSHLSLAGPLNAYHPSQMLLHQMKSMLPLFLTSFLLVPHNLYQLLFLHLQMLLLSLLKKYLELLESPQMPQLLVLIRFHMVCGKRSIEPTLYSFQHFSLPLSSMGTILSP